MTLNITPDLQIVFNAFIFESFIAILWFFLLIIIYKHNQKKKSKLTDQLLKIFMMYFFGLFFAWLAKLLSLIYGYNTIELFPLETPGLWVFARIIQYRLTFSFILVGTFLSTKFRNSIFKKEENSAFDRFLQIYTIISILFSLICYIPEQRIFDLITFMLAFILVIICYVPFMLETFKLSKKIRNTDKIYKNALISIGCMCIFFLLIFFGMVIDRAMMVFIDGCLGYTIFYYIGWIAAILGVITAFLGYIRPTYVKPKD